MSGQRDKFLQKMGSLLKTALVSILPFFCSVAKSSHSVITEDWQKEETIG